MQENVRKRICAEEMYLHRYMTEKTFEVILLKLLCFNDII